MVLFYIYKFLKMGIQEDMSFFFCLELKSLSEVDPKHTTS